MRLELRHTHTAPRPGRAANGDGRCRVRQMGKQHPSSPPARVDDCSARGCSATGPRAQSTAARVRHAWACLGVRWCAASGVQVCWCAAVRVCGGGRSALQPRPKAACCACIAGRPTAPHVAPSSLAALQFVGLVGLVGPVDSWRLRAAAWRKAMALSVHLSFCLFTFFAFAFACASRQPSATQDRPWRALRSPGRGNLTRPALQSSLLLLTACPPSFLCRLPPAWATPAEITQRLLQLHARRSVRGGR